MTIKVGQIYKEKQLPYWRAGRCDTFVISDQNFNSLCLIYKDGTVQGGSLDWVKGDCELIAEYPSWREAVNSKEFQ